MRSVDAAMAPFRWLQSLLAAITAAGVVLFAFGTARRDEIGELARTFELMRDGIVGQQAEIRELAYTDRLTRLPNRASFRDAVGAAIGAAHAGQSVAVLMLDLDRFRQVKDERQQAGVGIGADDVVAGSACALSAAAASTTAQVSPGLITQLLGLAAQFGNPGSLEDPGVGDRPK